MEAIKSAVGFGKKEQEGQEPVAGVKGEGTAGEPYDSGNQQGDSELGGKAPQETDPSKVTGQAPVDDKAAAAVDSTTTSGKSEEPIASDPVPAATSASASASAPATNESETSKATGSSESKKATIGTTSWFKTAIPFGKRKGDESAGQSNGGHQATAGALDNGAAKEVSGMDESGLPPNHLGANVPVGTSTEPVDTPTNETTSKDTMTPTNAATPAQGGEAATHDTAPAPTTAHPQTSMADTHAKTATEQPQQYVAEGEPSQQQQQTSSGGGGGLFSNPFSSSSKKMENEAPPSLEKRRLSREAYGSNPNAIPTAGGKRVGSVAFEQRGKSMDVRRSGSLTQSSVPAEKEEGGAGITSAGGTAGGAAGGAAAAPSVSSSAERAPDTTKAGIAANSVPPPVSTPSTTSAAAKTDGAPPRASLSPSEGREHSRRKSIFDKVKDKLPGHHHKEH